MSMTQENLHVDVLHITITIPITLTLNPLRNSFFIDHATFLQCIQIRIPIKFRPWDIGDAEVYFPVILPFLSLNTLTRSPRQLHETKELNSQIHHCVTHHGLHKRGDTNRCRRTPTVLSG